MNETHSEAWGEVIYAHEAIDTATSLLAQATSVGIVQKPGVDTLFMVLLAKQKEALKSLAEAYDASDVFGRTSGF